MPRIVKAYLASLQALLALIAAPALAQEPGTPPVPAEVAALAGCWTGSGQVMGKSVSIDLRAAPVALGAMLAVDAKSIALADADDRYAAHLVLGGTDANGGVTGYWSDSFGGAHAAAGRGTTSAGGFEIAYDYGADAFVNHWRIAGTKVEWRIVAVSAKDGSEKDFASYALTRAPCDR